MYANTFTKKNVHPKPCLSVQLGNNTKDINWKHKSHLK